jgi:hypothetical protein
MTQSKYIEWFACPACRYLALCGRRRVPGSAQAAFQQAEALGVSHNAHTFTGMISMCGAGNPSDLVLWEPAPARRPLSCTQDAVARHDSMARCNRGMLDGLLLSA